VRPADRDRDAGRGADVLSDVLHPHQHAREPVLVVELLHGGQVVPVLQPVEDAAAADPAPRHGVDPTVDRVEVAAEEAPAQLLVPQVVVEDGARDRHDLPLPLCDAQRRERHQCVGLPRDAEHLGGRSARREGRERRGTEDHGGIVRHPRPLSAAPHLRGRGAAQARSPLAHFPGGSTRRAARLLAEALGEPEDARPQVRALGERRDGQIQIVRLVFRHPGSPPSCMPHSVRTAASAPATSSRPDA
jgi:hypothetical protein